MRAGPAKSGQPPSPRQHTVWPSYATCLPSRHQAPGKGAREGASTCSVRPSHSVATSSCSRARRSACHTTTRVLSGCARSSWAHTCAPLQMEAALRKPLASMNSGSARPTRRALNKGRQTPFAGPEAADLQFGWNGVMQVVRQAALL